ncbi:hypothetical protein [Methylovorus mays]|uniref:hypothetical protein n=1 Tax=Methylovorus mays TaxID=184077 RepID=UPI001E2852E9|nr:hypothetical protein [Methylovorus mays]MCB5207711.1 hypothetical protein [Methylovorus mays]
MTTKILTLRVPRLLYNTLCRDAGESGISVSAHARRLIEREHEAEQIDDLRRELLGRLDGLAWPDRQIATTGEEVLLLCRAIAAHLNPQLVAQARAKLTQKP